VKLDKSFAETVIFVLSLDTHFGGLVVVEAARRLAKLGHRIGFLGPIDISAVNTP